MSLADDVILLRPLTDEDVPAVTDACQDPDMQRWLSALPSPYTEEDARAWLASDTASQAVVDAKTGELLGSIGWRRVDQGNVQIGYWVKREARGRGIATRALSVLAGWAIHELGAPRVQLLAEPGNIGSCRVAEKAGFHREALLRGYIDFKGERRDALMFALLPEDLPGPPRATTRRRA
ncbi:MAG TPA: GNAT family N-acetyltransferase [Gaiellaceae bacterium]|nr:GNAT family N-acetyltransferase [Gaiellaceae bacterium]